GAGMQTDEDLFRSHDQSGGAHGGPLFQPEDRRPDRIGTPHIAGADQFQFVHRTNRHAHGDPWFEASHPIATVAVPDRKRSVLHFGDNLIDEVAAFFDNDR